MVKISYSKRVKKEEFCMIHQEDSQFFCVECTKGLCNLCLIAETTKAPSHTGHTISDTKYEFERVKDQVDLQI